MEAAPGVVGVEAGKTYAWIVRSSDGAVLVDAGLVTRNAKEKLARLLAVRQ